MNKEFVGYNYTMLFGKHKGELIGDIAETDPGYIVWLSDNKILKIETHIVKMCRDSVEFINEDKYGGLYGDLD